RRNFAARVSLALMSAVTGIWTFILLDRDSSWQPWLRYLILFLTALVVLGLLFGADRIKRVGVLLAVAGVIPGMLGTMSYTVATRPRRWPSSSSTWQAARSGITSQAAWAVAAAAPTRSRPGSRRASPRRPWVTPRSTT